MPLRYSGDAVVCVNWHALCRVYVARVVWSDRDGAANEVPRGATVHLPAPTDMACAIDAPEAYDAAARDALARVPACHTRIARDAAVWHAGRSHADRY